MRIVGMSDLYDKYESDYGRKLGDTFCYYSYRPVVRSHFLALECEMAGRDVSFPLFNLTPPGLSDDWANHYILPLSNPVGV